MDTTTILSPLGDTLSRNHTHADGSVTRHDSMGRLLARFTPQAGGGGTWSDPMGRVLERVQEFGGVTQHLDPMGTLRYTQQSFGQRDVLQDSLGQVLLRHDPMNGNVTNALGLLIARKV